MRASCCVPNCDNNSAKAPAGTTWHRLPTRDERVRKQWIQKIRRDPGKKFKPTRHTLVCSAHFLPSDFSVHCLSQRRRLKTEAVPSQFQWCTVQNDAESSRSARAAACSHKVLPRNLDSAMTNHTEVVVANGSHNVVETNMDITETNEIQMPMDLVTDVALRTRNENEPRQSEADILRERVTTLEHEKRLAEEERDSLRNKCETLTLECAHLKLSLAAASKKNKTLKSQVLCYESIKHDDKLVLYYTGLPGAKSFDSLHKYLKPKADKMPMWNGSKTCAKPSLTNQNSVLSSEERLFLTLLRLKLGVPVFELARIFKIAQSTVSRVFTSWITLLFIVLQDMSKIPSINSIKHASPPEFYEYPDTTLIIDCTEIRVQRPRNLIAQRQTFSNYKHTNTCKCLIAITPGGLVCFVSHLYGGSASDKHIVMDSGFIEALTPGHSVMADKGFNIENVLPPGVTLNVPPKFMRRDSQQMPADDVEETRKIAAVRVHVERAIRRMKSYRILQGVLPISMSDVADQIVGTCAFLTNLKPALIRSKE